MRYIRNNIVSVEKLIEDIRYAQNELLKMSRINCHAQDVYSVVTDISPRGPKCLVRIFIADKNHTLWRNYPGSPAYSVGPHDHKYGILIDNVSSNVINYNYIENEVGENTTKFSVVSGIDKNKAAVFKPLYNTKLLCVQTNRDYFYLDENQIHTMYVPFRQVGFWRVTEFYKPKETTNLYSNCINIDKNGHLKNQTEMYQSPEDLEEFRTKMINLLAEKK